MASLTALSAKPWEGYPVPDRIYMPHGMIGFEERRMLYWLGAEHYSGAGVIVDAGAYLGASAFALASGLAQSRHAGATHAVVHSYDRFVADDDYIQNDISQRFHPVPPGYDYQGLFEFQTALCRDNIIAHCGDFIASPVPDAPIEILFVDVAKTGSLNARLVEHYFTRLIPGKSVVVQQDFYQAWYPYIPITMEYFGDWFAVVDAHVAESSRLYLLTGKILRPRDPAIPRRPQRRPGDRIAPPRDRPRFRADPDDAARRGSAPSCRSPGPARRRARCRDRAAPRPRHSSRAPITRPNWGRSSNTVGLFSAGTRARSPCPPARTSSSSCATSCGSITSAATAIRI